MSRLESISPVDGASLGQRRGRRRAPAVAAAVGRAHEAFLAWRLVPPPRRGELVRLFGEVLREEKDALGRLVSRECGKILSEGPRRGPGDDRHLRFRGRPFPPALRPHHRHRAARPPDDGDLASARRGRRDLRVQLPGRGLGVECLPRLRLRRQRGLEAVREDAALRARRWRRCSRAPSSGSAMRRRGCSRSCRAAARSARRWPTIRACRWSRRPARPRMGRALGPAGRGAVRARPCSSLAATMR